MSASSSALLLCGATGIGAALLLLPFLPDYAYRVRMEWLRLTTSELSDEEKRQLSSTGLEVSSPEQVLHLSELDRNGHHNNARYLRELCFSRRYFCTRLGLWRILDQHGANLFTASQTIRYRREQFFLQRFKVQTRLSCISDKDGSLYIESKFIDVSSGFVNAVHLCRYKLITGKGKDPTLTPSRLLSLAGFNIQNIPQSPDSVPKISFWNMANEASSKELNPPRPTF